MIHAESSASRSARPAGASLSLLGALLAACGPSGPPTWAEDVAPLVYAECAGCHRPGGAAPSSLLTYEEARDRAAVMAEVTTSRLMPPWLPARTGHPLEGERRLTDDQIETIRRWAEAGAPRGDPAAAPSPPTWSGEWTLGEPDLVVEMADTFGVSASGGDVFRNFVIPLPVERTRHVRGVELLPGNARVVHHAVMNVDPTPYSRLADARDEGQGFGGMESVSQARTPGSFFLGWTPGRVPAFNPPGMAWPLDPGTDLVLQLHLRPTGEPEAVRARVGFHFTDEPPERIPLLLRMGGQTLDIPPGDTAYVVDDSFTLPAPVRLVGAYPHAHYLGHRVSLTALRPGGAPDTLLYIADWDFNWQDAYRWEEPIALPEGTELRMRWVYDNSAGNPQNPHRPPRRVVLGYQSTDEMAELHLQVLAVSDEGREVLDRAIGRKSVADQVEAWNHMLTLDADDPEAHFGLGTFHQANGRLADATEHYRRALAADPGHARAHYNLGLVFERRGDTAAAEEHYRRAIESFPEYANALTNLGTLLVGSGRGDEALGMFRRAVEADPGHADARNNLGNALREAGSPGEAEGHYRAALRARPDHVEARFNLAATLLTLGRPDEAVEELDRGLGAAPDALQPRIAVAWALATAPEPDLRRPEAAVRLAEEAGRRTGGRHPLVLDVLAAAYAAAGRFGDAVRAADRAESLARAAGEEALARRIREHGDRFRSGEVWVEG